MCGIAGWLNAPGTSAAWASRLLEVLHHRGPDDQGIYADRGVGEAPLHGRAVTWGEGEPEAVLLHRRLSILDLSEAGWQPMRSPSGRYVITFNGEVYNYVELRRELEASGRRFVSDGDTEVVLAAYEAWGPACLRRFIGMFALAVWDVERRSLFLARDFFGIKPLFWARQGRTFLFASEIKALLATGLLPRRVRPNRLFDYLRYGQTDDGEETLLEGIAHLPASHWMEVSLEHPERARPVRYWTLTPQPAPRRLEDAQEAVRAAFMESVGLHLRSDVPVGAALSGGIDSSSIVCAMRRLGGARAEVHTFTFVAPEAAISEERHAATVAAAIQATAHTSHPSPEDLEAELASLIAIQDEPIVSTSPWAQLCVFRQAREAGIKVMLDGQGADELMAGYPVFYGARLASQLLGGDLAGATRLVRALVERGEGRALLSAGQHLVPPAWQGPLRRLVGQEVVPPWLDAAWFEARGVVGHARHAPPSSGERLRGLLMDALTRTSLPMLLRYEDRSSMACSIESRVPFLTPQLAELLLGLPERWLLSDAAVTKAVFREAMAGLVPRSILERRDKIGFLTPERGWLRALTPWVERHLTSDTARRIPALDLPAVQAHWERSREGGRWDGATWRHLNLIAWAEQLEVDF